MSCISELLIDEPFYVDGINFTLSTEVVVDTVREESTKIDKYTMTCRSTQKSVAEIKKFCMDKYFKYMDKRYPEVEENFKHVYFEKKLGEALRYNKVELVSTKSFDNLFIPNKKYIRNVVECFKNKSAIYGVPGVQHKLGVILHGVPGCGKTSFIKAIANELEYSVVCISLKNYKTIDELVNVFCGNRLQGALNQFDVPANRRIIVIEEIDTSGDTVANRQVVQESLLASNSAEEKEISSFIKPEPKIDLGDLLTTLDGLQELDGVVYVMTTNHYDYLDPALVRPGRITLNIELGLMKELEIKEMLTFYYISHEFRDVDYVDRRRRLISNVSKKLDNKYTPAELDISCQTMSFEDFCAKFNQ
jgi:SpoVK/Ycf46/Vps4 family AAA+-type ATPase